jgi:hypothetical protein
MPAKCTHAAAQHAVSLPGVPCEECRAFVDRDGSLMNADMARQRYPAYRTSFDEHEARWRPRKTPGRILGTSEQERRSNIKFLVWSAVVVAAILLVVGIVVFGGHQSQANQEAVQHCPGVAQAFEGKCGSVRQDEQTQHDEQVESEAHEVEGVIKHRAAEETANAVEGAAK